VRSFSAVDRIYWWQVTFFAIGVRPAHPVNPEETQKIIVEVSAYAVQLRNGFSYLRFRTEMEAAFRRERLLDQLVQLRKNIWLVAALFVAFALMSLLVAPPAHQVLTVVVHLCYLVPLAAGLLALTYHRRPYQMYARVAPALAVLMGAGLAVIDAVTSLDGVDLLYSDLLVFSIYVYFLLGFLFYEALFVNALIAALTFFIAIGVGVAEATALHHALLTLVSMVIGAAITYAVEAEVRKSYLVRHKMQQQLDTADRDSLTGIYNRRAFDDTLTRDWAQAQREGVPMAVILVDIDFFKPYNDRYGHQKGDLCLQSVAEALARAARRALDTTARYGGEEFAVILYNPTRDYLAELTQQIHENVNALAIPNAGSTVAETLTVSIGVGFVVPTVERSKEGLVQLADEALYKAKCEGRNTTRFGESAYASLKTGVFRHPLSA
jgi:diguanylate cyclase (GGDEF)-like protein